MNLKEIKTQLHKPEYSFLKDNEYLNKNIILLGLGGSHAYGMEKETSDLDIRGIALNPKKDILLATDFEQVVDTNTDTTIYSFNKMIELLTKSNPNTVEILGLKPEHYLYMTDIGKELLDNKKMFLSKQCIHTFAGYANAQLRRLENKAARNLTFSEKEKHILKTLEHSRYGIEPKYFSFGDGSIELFLGNAKENNEILADIHLTGYPLRDYDGLLSEMKAIIRSYEKNSTRNEKAESHDKLGKHMAHLLRLYIMCLDILEKEEIVTYREKEHDLLMNIRNGKYLKNDKQPIPEFFDILNEYEKRFEYAAKNTSLPDKPDIKKIEEFRMNVNERVIKDKKPFKLIQIPKNSKYYNKPTVHAFDKKFEESIATLDEGEYTR